jgi:hypothetical protein
MNPIPAGAIRIPVLMLKPNYPLRSEVQSDDDTATPPQWISIAGAGHSAAVVACARMSLILHAVERAIRQSTGPMSVSVEVVVQELAVNCRPLGAHHIGFTAAGARYEGRGADGGPRGGAARSVDRRVNAANAKATAVTNRVATLQELSVRQAHRGRSIQIAVTDDFRVQRSKSVRGFIVGIHLHIARNYAPCE